MCLLLVCLGCVFVSCNFRCSNLRDECFAESWRVSELEGDTLCVTLVLVGQSLAFGSALTKQLIRLFTIFQPATTTKKKTFVAEKATNVNYCVLEATAEAAALDTFWLAGSLGRAAEVRPRG